MKITLINPRLRYWSPTIVPPLGLLYVAASLEKHGHEVKIVDMNARKVSDKELEEVKNESNVIGITGMITEYQQVIKLVNKVKRTGNRVIVGGALATTFPKEILNHSYADCVVVGEGEWAVFDAIDRHDKIIKATQVENLDLFSFPSRHLLDMNRYNTQFHDFKGSIKSTTLISSRGCPYSCTFCYKDMWGYKWRARSPINILNEMDSIWNAYGIRGFIFNDDTFVLDRKRVLEFCQHLRERPYKWMCNGRVNLMTPELLWKMANSGCVEIAYGLESGSQKMLDIIKKNITLEQVRNVVKWTKDVGMRVNGYFMLGLPGETKELIKRTIDFAESLGLDFYGFSLATPMPNTEMYKYAMDNGYISKNYALELADWSFKANVNMTVDCTDKELLQFKNDVFKRFTLKRFGLKYLFGRVLEVLRGIQSFGELKSFVSKALAIVRK